MIEFYIMSALGIGFCIIGVCSFIAALTPNKKDDAALAPIIKAINIIACNIGHARNKEDA